MRRSSDSDLRACAVSIRREILKYTMFYLETRQNNGTMRRLSDSDLRACAGSTRREILKHTLFY